MINNEILVILLVALIVFDSKKLPMLAQDLIKMIHKIKKAKKELAIFLEKILKEDELKKKQEKAVIAEKKYKKIQEKTQDKETY